MSFSKRCSPFCACACTVANSDRPTRRTSVLHNPLFTHDDLPQAAGMNVAGYGGTGSRAVTIATLRGSPLGSARGRRINPPGPQYAARLAAAPARGGAVGLRLRLQGARHRARCRLHLGGVLLVVDAPAGPDRAPWRSSSWSAGSATPPARAATCSPSRPMCAVVDVAIIVAGQPLPRRRLVRMGAAVLAAPLGLPLSRGLRRGERAHLFRQDRADRRRGGLPGPARLLRLRAPFRRARRFVPRLHSAERPRPAAPAHARSRASIPWCSW